MKRFKKIVIEGIGYKCPKCNIPMERRKHRIQPDKIFYYSKWDYCKGCRYIQHYELFRSSNWSEKERQEDHLRNIMK